MEVVPETVPAPILDGFFMIFRWVSEQILSHFCAKKSSSITQKYINIQVFRDF